MPMFVKQLTNKESEGVLVRCDRCVRSGRRGRVVTFKGENVSVQVERWKKAHRYHR